MKAIRKWFLVLTSVLLAFSVFPTAGFADDPEEAEEAHHYLVFGSDLHADADNVGDSAYGILSEAMKGLPAELDYVSILGDVIGDGEEAPEYLGSDIFGPARAAVSSDDWELMGKYFSIVGSEQDVNVEPDVAQMVVLPPDSSEEVMECITFDGKVFGYVYGIGAESMTAGGDQSRQSADFFKRWVKNKNVTLPIIVLSHYPIQALAGDNPGAAAWNEALNYAATGVEGITGIDENHPIIRNVIFLSGHNHIQDKTEYVFPANSVMPVQGEAMLGGGGTEDCTIYYTSVTAGYLKDNGTCTLLDLSDDSVTISKYSGGKTVSLGTNGATGEPMEQTLQFPMISESDEGGPVITKQPESTYVNYPEGAEFSVEVEDPDQVASYQWYVQDQVDQVFELEGASAKTDTLVVPSTARQSGTLRFYCVVTGKDGLQTFSERATLEKDNPDEIKPVFYVGEYALEPGDSLDLASVDFGDGNKLGSGTVTFDSNGTDITLDQVVFDNTHRMAGQILAPNVGFDFEYENPEVDEYDVIFKGDNQIVNTYFDPDYNSAGIPFDFCITGEEEKPLVNFTGDGTLSVTNGTIAIRVIGDLSIDIDLTVGRTGTNYGDGISAQNILVGEGKKVNLDVNGYGFNTEGNLFAKGAQIDINSTTPHVSQGMVTKNVINCHGTISLENTKLSILAVTDQSICEAAGGNTLISADGELFITAGSEVSAEAQLVGEGIFGNSFTGINAISGEITDSNVSLKIDSPSCMNAMGAYIEEDLVVTGSDLTVDQHASGAVYGITAEGNYTQEDSRVEINTENYPDGEISQTFGLVCAKLDYEGAGKDTWLKTAAADGLAVGIDLGEEISDTEVTFEEDYTSANIVIGEGVDIQLPEDYAISLGSLNLGSEEDPQYAVMETVYDRADTTKPASAVTIGTAAAAGGAGAAKIAIPCVCVAAVAAIAIGAGVKRKKKKAE